MTAKQLIKAMWYRGVLDWCDVSADTVLNNAGRLETRIVVRPLDNDQPITSRIVTWSQATVDQCHIFHVGAMLESEIRRAVRDNPAANPPASKPPKTAP